MHLSVYYLHTFPKFCNYNKFRLGTIQLSQLLERYKRVYITEVGKQDKIKP